MTTRINIAATHINPAVTQTDMLAHLIDTSATQTIVLELHIGTILTQIDVLKPLIDVTAVQVKTSVR
ncbi:MAG: hypothetical protein LC540_19565 [Candidatus Thiodiazotropha sp.]|nr:hypothetical protein [Candidatus Thiodiazotropha sp.]